MTTKEKNKIIYLRKRREMLETNIEIMENCIENINYELFVLLTKEPK